MHIKTSFLILSNKDYLTNNTGYFGSNAMRINKTITNTLTSSTSKRSFSALYNLGKHEKGGLTESMHKLDSIQNSRLNPHGTITLQTGTNLAQSRDLRIRRWHTWRGMHDIIYELFFGVSRLKRKRTLKERSTGKRGRILNHLQPILRSGLKLTVSLIPFKTAVTSFPRYVYCSPCRLCTFFASHFTTGTCPLTISQFWLFTSMKNSSRYRNH